MKAYEHQLQGATCQPAVKSSASNTAVLDGPTSLRSRDRHTPTLSLSSKHRRPSRSHHYHRRGIHSLNALQRQDVPGGVGTQNIRVNKQVERIAVHHGRG